MTIQKNKSSERYFSSDYVFDRFVNGRMIDDGEYYDRITLFRQLGLILRIPHKQAPRRFN